MTAALPASRRGRASSILAWTCLLLGGGILAALGVWYVWIASLLGVTHVRGLGNFEETLRLLPPPSGEGFRFAFIGDPHGSKSVFVPLMRKARELGASFVVCPGDLCKRPTEEGFQIFNRIYAGLGAEALPFFTAQGNHDVSPERLFQRYYGPEDYSFLYGDSLFIFDDNNDESQYPQIARHVRDTIRRHRGSPLDSGKVRHVFVVLHRPVNDYTWKGEPIKNEERCAELFKVLEEERVDAVLTGHYHAYLRERRGPTLLLVSGGGGYVLQPEVGFNHMVLFDVTPDGIRDALVRLEGGANHIIDRVRCEAALHYPTLFGAWWRPLPAILLGAVLLAFGARRCVRRGGRLVGP